MHPPLFELSIFMGKAAVILIVVVILYRLLGKRELAQMNAYDLVTIVAVSNALQNGMTQGRGELLVGIAVSGTLVLVAYLFSRLFLRFPGSEKLLLGEPVVLLSNGQPNTAMMQRERVSRDALLVALREHGLSSPEEAALAVLEIDGSISVVPCSEVLEDPAG